MWGSSGLRERGQGLGVGVVGDLGQGLGHARHVFLARVTPGDRDLVDGRTHALRSRIARVAGLGRPSVHLG